MEALRRFLSSSEAFMPHGHCYLWKPGLVWLHVVSDGLIALAYLSIPFTLLHFARRRRDLPFRWVFLAFGAFIVSCGATHALEVWNVWQADYWPAGLVKAVTAAMSVATAVLLARAVPEALALPSPAQLSQAHEELARAHAELRRAYGEEKAALHERTTELRAAGTRIRDEARARGVAEERFQAVYEQSRLGIALVTAGELRFVSANSAYCRMLGFTEAELRERSAFDVIHPDDRAGARRAATSPAAAPPLPIEQRQVRKDGGVIWARVLTSPLRDETGREALWLAMIEDISDAKRAEEALRESEARMRAIVETAVDGIVTIGEGGRIESFNPAAERLFGYTASEAIGQNVSLLMPAPYREEHDDYLRNYLATGVRKVIGIGREVVGRHKDGSEFPIDIAVTEFRLGERRLFTGIVRDLTARKLAEEGRAQAEEQLRQSQKLEAIGQLAGGVAHDFNNTLGVITGYGERARKQIPEGHPARPRLEQMIKAAERAAGLTRQLLAFSRKQVMEPRLLELNAVVSDLDKMLRRVVGEDVEIEVRAAERLGTVRVDPTQIQQIIMNLVVNARDAMPKGGRLTIETADAEFDESYAAEHPPAKAGRFVMLAISDTGIGMDAETQRRIFEPFFTTKPAGEGTGLGLATVYGIVKQSGGYIWVYSEPGQGTTFKVYLPCVDEPTPAEAAAAAATPAPRGHETVLLVEDTESLREMIREVLAEQGYTVLLASQGEEALALAREHEEAIDLLLTDVVMPKLGGGDLARQLRRLRPAVRVLYMSGYTNGAVSRQGVLDEGVVLLEKPFTGDRLAHAVREALDRSKSG